MGIEISPPQVVWSTLTGKPTFGTASAQDTSAFDASGSATAAQAFAIQRANQTGSQVASTISDFAAVAIAAVTWSTLTGKPTFATVATSGAYADLTGKPMAVTADTGWTANADAGDKTVVIGSTATLDTIATALNIVTAGAGTQLENIAQKVKALEATLVTFKVPNV